MAGMVTIRLVHFQGLSHAYLSSIDQTIHHKVEGLGIVQSEEAATIELTAKDSQRSDGV